MADPINWKSKTLLIKPEGATYGVDPVPTGAANAILATDVQLQPMEGEDVSRNLELPWMAAQSTKNVALRAVLTFTVELAGSGTAGTPPAWGRSSGLAVRRRSLPRTRRSNTRRSASAMNRSASTSTSARRATSFSARVARRW